MNVLFCTINSQKCIDIQKRIKSAHLRSWIQTTIQKTFCGAIQWIKLNVKVLTFPPPPPQVPPCNFSLSCFCCFHFALHSFIHVNSPCGPVFSLLHTLFPSLRLYIFPLCLCVACSVCSDINWQHCVFNNPHTSCSRKSIWNNFISVFCNIKIRIVVFWTAEHNSCINPINRLADYNRNTNYFSH